MENYRLKGWLNSVKEWLKSSVKVGYRTFQGPPWISTAFVKYVEIINRKNCIEHSICFNHQTRMLHTNWRETNSVRNLVNELRTFYYLMKKTKTTWGKNKSGDRCIGIYKSLVSSGRKFLRTRVRLTIDSRTWRDTLHDNSCTGPFSVYPQI